MFTFASIMKASESRYCRCLYFTTSSLARKVEKLAAGIWKQAGLSPSHAYLLMVVLEEPGIQPGNLAAELQLTPSTITRLLEKLEAKKLVVRTSEGKLTNVYPTPKAKELLPVLKQSVYDFHQQYVSILGKDESDVFIRNMNKMADKLEG